VPSHELFSPLVAAPARVRKQMWPGAKKRGGPAAHGGQAEQNGIGWRGERHLFGKPAFRRVANSKRVLKPSGDVVFQQYAGARDQRVATP